jgi:hypothetical protein
MAKKKTAKPRKSVGVKGSSKRGAATRERKGARTSAQRPSPARAVSSKRSERAKLAQIARSEPQASEAQQVEAQAR